MCIVLHLVCLTIILVVNLRFPLHEQIPNWFEGESSGSTKDNPFPLPDAYVKSQQKNVSLESPLLISDLNFDF